MAQCGFEEASKLAHQRGLQRDPVDGHLIREVGVCQAMHFQVDLELYVGAGESLPPEVRPFLNPFLDDRGQYLVDELSYPLVLSNE